MRSLILTLALLALGLWPGICLADEINGLDEPAGAVVVALDSLGELTAEAQLDTVVEGPAEHPVYRLRPEPFGLDAALIVSLDELLELAVLNNISKQAQELTIEKNHYSVDQTYYQFDPTLSASLGYNLQNRGGISAATSSGVSSSESYQANFNYTIPREEGDSLNFRYGLSRSSYSLTGSEGMDIPTNYNANFDVSYTRPLMRGAGKLINLLPRYTASNNLALSYDKLDDDIRNLKKNVLDTYYRVLSAQEALSVREAALERALKQLERSVERYKVGLALVSAVNQAENSVLAQKSQLLNAHNSYVALLDQLTVLVGLPVEIVVGLDAGGAMIEVGEQVPAELWALVEENSYALKSLNTQLANLKLSRESVINQLEPNLGLSLNYSRSGEDETFERGISGYENESYGVTLNYSKTPGERRTQAQLAQLELDLASLELSIQDTQLQLKSQLRNLQRTLATRHQQITLAMDSLAVSEETYEIMLAREDVGLAVALDVIEAQENVLNAELALLDARIAYQETYREILLMAGLI